MMASFVSLTGIPGGAAAVIGAAGIGAGESGCGGTQSAAGGCSIAGVMATGSGAGAGTTGSGARAMTTGAGAGGTAIDSDAGCAGLATVRGAFAVTSGFESDLAVGFTISVIHAPLFGVMSRSLYTIRGGAQISCALHHDVNGR
ncbi:hypothetical protein ASE79_10365 [Sphingomonas sp. Leaf28]|nr:hypothetical protein ASE79_10365 [Sphingomonas sp. Leaf28]